MSLERKPLVYRAGPVDYPLRPIEVEGRLLQVVVLDCPYDSRHHPIVQDILPKISALKIDGYLREYPYGVMPVDSYDQFGTHLIVCEVRDSGKLVPIMGMKATHYTRCLTHRCPFPPYLLTEHLHPNPYAEAVRAVCEKASAEGLEVGYNGSFTIAPEVRKNKTLARKLRDLVTAFFVWHYAGQGIRHLITGATVRFKMDDYTRFLGFKTMEWEGKKLPYFRYEAFFGELIELMYLTEFSAGAHAVADELKPFWESRIQIDRDLVIADDQPAEEKEKKAA